jgi:amidohydrolase
MTTLDISTLRAEAEAMRDELVAVRRDLHAHPELAFEEVRTAGIVAKALGELGYEVQTGIGKTGVVGVMESNDPGGETLLLRFDMDALPVHEAVDVDFKSTVEGKMHACGHDAHTSIGLGVARMLARHRDQWKGTAKFVFQPAEEIVSGARAMIADGVLQNPAPTRSLSMHVWSNSEVGTVAITDGPMMASVDGFDLTITGRGAHGASPHEGVDPVVAAAQIITALQSIVSRNVAPLDQGVVTVGAIHAGSAHNIIPDTVTLKGTIRAFKDETMQLLCRRIREIVEGVSAAMGVSAELQFAPVRTPATVNNSAMVEIVRSVARDMVGDANLRSDHRTMGAEDCSYFLNAAPGAYVFVGAGNKDKGMTEPHHSPRFQIDEDSLPLSVALVTASALKMG